MNIIHLSRAEYKTLSTTGTLTKSGVTYIFDPLNNEYVVPDQKFLHTLRCFVGDDGGFFQGVIKIINKDATPITQLSSDLVKTCVSASGAYLTGGSYQGTIIAVRGNSCDMIDSGNGNLIIVTVPWNASESSQQATFSSSIAYEITALNF